MERRSLVPSLPAGSSFGGDRFAGSHPGRGGRGDRGGGGFAERGRRWPDRPRGVRPEDEADFLPSYEDESQEAVPLRRGARVRHPSWGEGVVENVEGSGEQLKLTIRFRGGVLKKVLAVYAKLELLG